MNQPVEQGAWRWLGLRPSWSKMADLAEAVDDLICSFDYMDTAMDNLALTVFLAVVVALLVLALARWAHSRFRPAEKPVEKPVEKPEPVKSVTEIVSATDGVLATSARVKASSVPTKKPVPATPPNRKRLSRMSPGPEGAGRRAQSVAVPTATGPDAPSVQWVNDMFLWLYNDLVIVNELVQQWIQSMNEFSKKSVEEQGIGVELVRAIDSHPPTLTGIYCECDTKDDVTITCDCEATPAFQLKAFRQQGDKVEVSHYRLNVNRFRARLSIVCVTEKLTGEVRCDGWPDVKLALAPVGPLRPDRDEKQLQALITDVVTSALRNTQLSLNLSQYPTCPRLRRHLERGPPGHYDLMMRPESRSTQYSGEQGAGWAGYGGHAGGAPQLLGGDKRLLVKVVAAKDLGGKEGCKAPYCVVEMDEPPQRNQTAVRKDTTSPVWDEHFLFDLSPGTAELLFEVYDKAAATGDSPRFLGLGIVGIDELLVSPSQRQLIGLQARPMEDQAVSGVLTVEFLFIEGAEVPDTGARPFKLKETLRTVSPAGHTLTTTKTTFQPNGLNNCALTETALRELELSPSSANKSTLIIHSVQREPKKSVKVEKTSSGKFIEIERSDTETDGRAVSQTVSPKTSTPHQSPKSVRIVEVVVNGEKLNGNAKSDADMPGDYVSATSADGEAGDVLPEPTPRKKRRDFFSTIKRRLGRSRTRGREADGVQSEDEAKLRSVSAERARNGDTSLSVPNRTVYSAGASPAQSGDESRTSRSEVSGFSAASARTFIHEASTLVLETIEAGIKKHYLVPLAVAQKTRWRRKGVKLHIYNDHTFVAKHLSGGTVCEVCGKSVARRIGKQGYECRDCLLKCHKQCHVKVTAGCPQSTVRNMELSMLPVLNE